MLDLSADQWHQLQTLFHHALDLDGDERDTFLRQQDAEHPDLASALRGMIRNHSAANALLDQPEDAFAGFAADAPRHDLSLPNEDTWPAAEVGQAPPQIGPYALIEEIGRGGMGAVYRAERTDGIVQQTVAIKLLRRGLDTEDLIARFQTERHILAALNHPNIARLLDAGALPDGRPFLIMEYIDGVPITTYCAQQQLSLEQRLGLFRTVCMAVHAAHRSLIVHRDLKPQNILVTPDGTVKLLDFGIAKLLDPGAAAFTVARTAAPLRLLTPEYAAPEQVQGGLISTSTDVYSLGVLLVELLTGRRPYALPSRVRQEVERVICEEPPTRPSTLVDEGSSAPLPPERLRRRLRAGIDAIALHALRKEPERRYGSAEALAADVERYLDGVPLEARPASWQYRTGLFIARHRVAVTAATIVVLALGIGLGTALWQARIANAERTIAQQEAARAEAVKDFLIDSFESGLPGNSRADTLTVLSWLRASGERLDTAFTRTPVVRRDMLTTMGDVYRVLGFFDEALAYQQQAHMLATQHFTPVTKARADADLGLGILYLERGEYANADSVLEAALRQFEALEDMDDIVRARQAYANNLYYHADDRTTALEMHKANVAYLESLDPAPLDRLSAAYSGAGRMSLVLGDVEACRFYFGKFVETSRLADPESPNLASALNGYGISFLYEPADRERAKALFEEALAMHRRVMPKDHYRIAQSLLPLAEILWEEGEREEAEAMAVEALRLRRLHYPPDHFSVAESMLTHGNMLFDKGDFEAARALFLESYEIYLVARGPAYRYTIASRENLANTLDSLGLPDQAARYRVER